MNTTYDAIYAEAIASGATPRFADMLASRQAPGAKTDESFTRGQGTLADQFDGDEKSFNTILAKLKKKGFVPNRNSVYVPTLANSDADPLAFVPSGAGARAHIKKVCEMRNLDCTGVVNHKRRETPPTPSVPLAENIIKRTIGEILQADPGARKLGKEGLRAEAIKRRARKGTKV